METNKHISVETTLVKNTAMALCFQRFFISRNSPQWARASSFTRFLDHTQRRTTVGRTPLDAWSARRRDLYLTTHNTHNRHTSMPPVGFETTISAGERPQTYALDSAATGTGVYRFRSRIFRHRLSVVSVKCFSETWPRGMGERAALLESSNRTYVLTCLYKRTSSTHSQQYQPTAVTRIWALLALRKQLYVSNKAWLAAPLNVTQHEMTLHLCLILQNAVKNIRWNEGVACCILNIGTKWQWVVNFMPWQFYLREMILWHMKNRRMLGPPHSAYSSWKKWLQWKSTWRKTPHRP